MTAPTDRLPPLPRERMTPAQAAAADALIASPRKGVKGPFVALLRSPELMTRLQQVGDYLRFDSALPPRLAEFATLVVARQWTQTFEWGIHRPLALQAGTAPQTLEALRAGSRPTTMSADEAVVYDFIVELTTHRGVADETYRSVRERVGEQGVVDLVGTVGYFVWMSMLLNVAQTPADAAGVERLPALPAQSR
jgi:4-carboxymuconolactone decarboxylase